MNIAQEDEIRVRVRLGGSSNSIMRECSLWAFQYHDSGNIHMWCERYNHLTMLEPKWRILVTNMTYSSRLTLFQVNCKMPL